MIYSSSRSAFFFALTLLVEASACESVSQLSTQRQISECSVATSDGRGLVTNKIIDGDILAIKCAFKNIKLFDGGDLEELYIATALHFDKDPKSFFNIMHEFNIQDNQIASIIGMLPDDYVDRIPAKISAYKARLALLNSMHSVRSETREALTKKLKDSIALLERNL